MLKINKYTVQVSLLSGMGEHSSYWIQHEGAHLGAQNILYDA